jgi:NAD(P)-dependent dehydrogenase (short-subunit alcohol dehydrogenase family)
LPFEVQVKPSVVLKQVHLWSSRATRQVDIMSGDLARVILIAGASGGIGGACARALAGYTVVTADLPEVDVTQPGAADEIVRHVIDKHGSLHGVVHAVGMSGRRLGDGPLPTCSDDAWSEVLRVNLTSVFWLMRAALPAVADSGGGSFVSIGSVLGDSLHPDFLTTAYSASKMGLVGLTRAAALSMADRNVRVNIVAPAVTDTAMASRAVSSPDIRAALNALMPLGKGPLDALDVANAVAWLLSDQAKRITGTTITVDGGWSLR